MGLDWIVESKPCEGDEKEFKKLQKQLRKLNEDNPGSEEIEEIEELLKDISITPQDTIGDFNDDELEDYDEIMIGGSFLTSSLDFRGKNISYSELIDDELKEEAYEHHNPNECIEYANKLELSLAVHNKDTLTEEQKEDYDNVNRGIKWLKFWGTNGHGYHAWC